MVLARTVESPDLFLPEFCTSTRVPLRPDDGYLLSLPGSYPSGAVGRLAIALSGQGVLAGGRCVLQGRKPHRYHSGLAGEAKRSCPSPVLWLLGVDAVILLNHHLLVTPSYYYFRFDQARTTEQGHNLVLAATFSKSAGRIAIDDRNRVLGFLIPGSDFWVYGNRLHAERSIGPEKKRMALIGWDELFFFSNTDSWQRNRVALSFDKGISDRLAIEPYLLHQTDGHIHPGNVNAFGLVFKVRVH